MQFLHYRQGVAADADVFQARYGGGDQGLKSEHVDDSEDDGTGRESPDKCEERDKCECSDEYAEGSHDSGGVGFVLEYEEN